MSDLRSNLLRLASELPKGSPERRKILAVLTKRGAAIFEKRYDPTKDFKGDLGILDIEVVGVDAEKGLVDMKVHNSYGATHTTVRLNARGEIDQQPDDIPEIVFGLAESWALSAMQNAAQKALAQESGKGKRAALQKSAARETILVYDRNERTVDQFKANISPGDTISYNGREYQVYQKKGPNQPFFIRKEQPLSMGKGAASVPPALQGAKNILPREAYAKMLQAYEGLDVLVRDLSNEFGYAQTGFDETRQEAIGKAAGRVLNSLRTAENNVVRAIDGLEGVFEKWGQRNFPG